MATYEYHCEACGHEFETVQSMSEDSLVTCPKCECDTLVKKICVPMVFIKGEPQTLGHQAARNTEKMGRYEYESAMEDRAKRIRQASDKMVEATGGKNVQHDGTLPWWRSGKVPGLPREERPISPAKAQKIIKELGITSTEPRKRKKK